MHRTDRRQFSHGVVCVWEGVCVGGGGHAAAVVLACALDTVNNDLAITKDDVTRATTTPSACTVAFVPN